MESSFLCPWKTPREWDPGEAWRFRSARMKACRNFRREEFCRWRTQASSREQNPLDAETLCRAKIPLTTHGSIPPAIGIFIEFRCREEFQGVPGPAPSQEWLADVCPGLMPFWLIEACCDRQLTGVVPIFLLTSDLTVVFSMPVAKWPMVDNAARDLFPGALEMLILESLRRQPAHGYALVRHKGSSFSLTA
jgi:hypothetical protein